MKTNKIFKNLLSLLTLGVVIFSCNKPGEGPKIEEENIQKAIANIKSIVFKKEKNSATENTSATPAYAALFVKRTPALPYTDDIYIKFDAVIEGDSVIKVLVPFDKTLNINTATTLTATITLNEKPGENVYLGDKKLTDSTAPFDYPISTTLVHANLIESTGGVSQVLEIKRKDKDGNVLIKKSFKVVFVHDIPSDNAIIGQDDFKFTIAASGINTITNFTPVGTNAVTPTADTTIKAHYVTPTGEDRKGTEDKPFEFQLRKSADSSKTPGELLAAGVGNTDYFKADALKLPDGAYIEVDATTAACNTNDCNNVNPITGIKSGTTTATVGQTDLKGHSTSGTAVEYKFTVVAQDGTTKKYYKLTINAAAPTS
ncbi:hypothetical protein [Ichthyobacterium seriolicida]|uniref:Uncharacterized protein n=1 Tax=Ichthyobacterium seriolicida TaxID=242600 RepID=A0A1J1EC99_9FLAO|nr:hypothetical protein [Ichthyobacterium seriolicida]BAV95136.1 hypothetical protein JBKA6_1123 [Ichthyobacterium seriolicida]